jgi:oxygen-independent coproporphyrinogen III oxidase
MRSFSIYFHIPFCLRRCPYCDFNSYALTSIPEREYVSALLSELDLRAAQDYWKGRRVQSIYFGGGTPSLLSPLSIRRMLNGVAERFPIISDPEITLEANPGTVSADSLEGFRLAGVNRLSLGAQSFQPELLSKLGRIHSVEQTEAAIAAAKSVGFTNFGLDIMYSIPGETLDQLRFDLREAVRAAPTHISAYGLTIEKGTPFYLDYKRGKLDLPDEDSIVGMMDEVCRVLALAGYERYEISNFAQTGMEARHNQVYWNGGDYLGLGAGAHSFLASFEGQFKKGGLRWSNYVLPNKYISQAVAHGSAECWRETLGVQELMFEFFFLGLRKIAGVSCSEFERCFGSGVEQAYSATLEVLYDQGLLKRDGDFIALTKKGLLVADSVIENFANVRAPEEVGVVEKAGTNAADSEQAAVNS